MKISVKYSKLRNITSTTMVFFYKNHNMIDLHHLFKEQYFNINDNLPERKYLKQNTITDFLLRKNESVIDVYDFINHNSNEIIHDDDYKISISTEELNILLFFQHLSKSLYKHFKKDVSFQDFLKIDSDLSILLSKKILEIKEKRIHAELIERQEYMEMLYG